MRFLSINPHDLIRRLAPWAAVLAVLWAGLWSAQSYVSAQDPSTIYLPLARQIADTDFSLAAIREAARWMAPGWPVVLAVSIKLGGPFAPAWIQLPFALLALIALWRIIARHAASVTAAWLAVGLTLLAWLAGPEPTFACLLYPFRELPAFACALWAVERAGRDGRISTALLAGGLLLATAGVRETFVPGAAAGAIAAVWLSADNPKAGWRRAGWILAPLVASVLILSICFPGSINRQVHTIWSNLAAGMLPAPLPEAASGLLSQMAGQVTWVGLLLPLLALARKETRGAGALLLVMTATLLAVHLLLPAHVRYGLTCSLLLPAGAALALTPIVHRLSPRTGWISAGAGFVALAALALSQNSWGASVSRAEVGETLRRVAASLPAGKPYYVERRGRRLAALLKGYSTSWPQGHAAHPVPGGVYFEVISGVEREDHAEGPLQGPTVSMQLRGAGMAMIPLGDRHGRFVPLHLAGTSFQLHRVRPNPGAAVR
jgi:hypothetical protein